METRSLECAYKSQLSDYIFALYLILLPIATGLSGVIGSISFLNYIALLYILFSVVGLCSNNKLRIEKELSVVYCYFLYTALSWFWCATIIFDWYYTTFLTTVLLFILVASRKYSAKTLRLYSNAIKISSVVVIIAALIGVYQNPGYRLIITLFSRMDPNDFACGLCTIIALLLSYFLTGKLKVGDAALLISMLCVIALSGSRGAMLMAACMIFASFLMSKSKNRLQMFFVALLIIIFVYMFSDKFLSDYLLSRFNFKNLLKDKGAGRLDIWIAALKKFGNSNPLRMLFGYGHGGFKEAVNYIAPGHTAAYAAHNMYINALLEGGIVGLSLLAAAFIKAFNYARKRKNYFGQLCLVGFFVEGISLDSQSYRIFAIVFIAAVIFDGDFFKSDHLCGKFVGKSKSRNSKVGNIAARTM